MIRFAVLAFVFTATLANAGEVFKWTGAESASWTNVANWQVKSGEEYVAATRCPGNGVFGDECIFGPLESGSTVVDITLDKFGSETYSYVVTNVYRIHIVGGAPSYTFQGPACKKIGSQTPQDWTALRFEDGGGITIDSDVTADQTVSCVIGVVCRAKLEDPNQSIAIKMYLNAPGVTLYLNGFANDASNKTSSMTFTGAGNLVWAGGSYGDWGPNPFSLQLTGTIRLTGTGSSESNSTLSPKKWSFYQAERITIPAGCSSLMARDGSPSVAGGVTFNNTVTVDGGGMLLMRSHNANDVYGLQAVAGATVTLDVCLANCGTLTSYHNHSAYLNGEGTFVLCSSNTFSEALMLGGGVTVKAAKFGNKKCSAEDSNIGTGSDIFYRGSGTLEYTGVGETCNRDLFVTNTANLTVGVKSSGSGPLELTGEVMAMATGTKLKLGGTAASPVRFKGSFAEASQNVTLQVNGVVDFSGLAAMPEKITAFEFLAGENELIVPEAVTTEIYGWQIPAAGTSINFVTRNGALVKLSGVTQKAQMPANVMLNGEPAKVGEDGVLALCNIHWKSAQDGNWNEAEKWTGDAVPGEFDGAIFDASGADYTVTLNDDSAEAVNFITVGNGTDANTATVSLQKDVSLDGSRVIQVEKGGKVVVTDGKVFEWNDVGSYYTTNILHGGELDFVGDSALKIDNRYSSSTHVGHLFLGTGTTIFTNTAHIVSEDGSGDHVYVTPNTPNGESRLKFLDESYWYSVGNGSVLAIGRNVPEGGIGVCDYELKDNDHSIYKVEPKGGKYTGGFCTWHIGCAHAGRTGNGVLNINRGSVRYSNNGLNVAINADGSAASFIAANSGTVITGIVNHVGGAVNGGSYMPGYQPNVISGFIVGNGSRLYEGNSVYGEYNFKGGDIVTSAGFVAIGLGPSAYGVLNVGDVENPEATQSASFSSSWEQGGGKYNNPSIIGFGKGKGLVNVFGPKASVYFRTDLYVGGTDVAGLRIKANGTSTRGDYSDATCLSGTREADGELRVSSGIVRSCNLASGVWDWKHVWVGADGKGTIAISGNATFQCRNLVLSNCTESVLKFVLPEDGVPEWTAEAKEAIYITDGAKLVVDASAVKTPRKWTKLASAAKEPTTESDSEFRSGKFEVIGDNDAARRYAEGTIVYERDGEHGIWLKTNIGFLMIIR